MSGQTASSRRPKQAKVMSVRYKITWLTEDEWYAQHLDQEAVGITERDSGNIWMRADPTSNEDSLRYTLLHELLHCCTQTTRLDKYLSEVKDPEEFFVSQVAPSLLQVFQDNPAVVAYLLTR